VGLEVEIVDARDLDGDLVERHGLSYATTNQVFLARPRG
jgi:hypothetical protein